MDWLSERPNLGGGTAGDGRTVVVAGPSSRLTIPGIIVSQMVQAFTQVSPVIRIEVHSNSDFDAGIHRAPSLAVAHDERLGNEFQVYEAPSGWRQRAQAFREWIPSDAGHAIAFAWPGIENGWIRQFVAAARAAGVKSTVACVSLPRVGTDTIVALADVMRGADLVLVGRESYATALRSAFGDGRTVVETRRALSLHGRPKLGRSHQITSFLPRDNADTLAALLTAFDAIPDAWIDGYRLQVVTRLATPVAKEMIASSYHAEFVEMLNADISTSDLHDLVRASSALIIADPAFDSRAFATAVDCGIATVIMASAKLPDVGRGYVGGLLADATRPVSIHVALNHALRLAELAFPSPDAWTDLVHRLLGTAGQPAAPRGDWAQVARLG